MPDLNIFPDTKIIDIKKSKDIDAFIDKFQIRDTRIRIMPSSVITPGRISGISIRTNRTISPNILGSDIGCGVLVVKLDKTDIDTDKLDDVIQNNIPYGRNIHIQSITSFDFETDRPYNRIERCLGTLGGGNHFIELCKDNENTKYLIVHSGSRGYGMMVSYCYDHNNYFTESDRKAEYYNNLRICMRFSKQNRRLIADIILGRIGVKPSEYIDIPHNYFDTNTGIMRKNAVDADKDKKTVIMLGENNGCLLCKGLGSEDHNYSAPASKTDDEQSVRDFIISISKTAAAQQILTPIYTFKPE